MMSKVDEILTYYYPEYKRDRYLPPELLHICINYLTEEKKEYCYNSELKVCS